MAQLLDLTGDNALVRGDTTVIPFSVFDEDAQGNEVAKNITGWTIFFTLKLLTDEAENDDAAVLAKNAIITNSTGGEAEVQISVSDWGNIPEGRYKADIQMKDPSGNIYTPTIGIVEARNDVTKRTV